MTAADSYSFLYTLNFLGLCLDFLGAMMIIYFGIWPTLNISNNYYGNDEYKHKVRCCARNCIAGLVMVVSGFILQLMDITSTYSNPLCC